MNKAIRMEDDEFFAYIIVIAMVIGIIAIIVVAAFSTGILFCNW